jgi:hypothetical protein
MIHPNGNERPSFPASDSAGVATTAHTDEHLDH